MYNAHFGFSDSPFENNLDRKFLFLSENHKEVLAALHYFVENQKAFALVCGDVGTGKSMILNCFVETLPDNVKPIIVSNPDVSHVEILIRIARTLQIGSTGKSVLQFYDELKSALAKASGQGKRFVLIIDEAHLLPDRTLEHIRLLSNIETAREKLLQILLVGQYELSPKLDRPEMRQLRQRININRFLAPMNSMETMGYIDHRLRIVGSCFESCFASDCKGPLFKMTEGVPRRINQVCDSALMICQAERQRKVTRKMLKKADEAMRSDLIFVPNASGSGWRSRLPAGPKSFRAATACIMILLVGAILGRSGGLGFNTSGLWHTFSPAATALSDPTSHPPTQNAVENRTISKDPSADASAQPSKVAPAEHLTAPTERLSVSTGKIPKASAVDREEGGTKASSEAQKREERAAASRGAIPSSVAEIAASSIYTHAVQNTEAAPLNGTTSAVDSEVDSKEIAMSPEIHDSGLDHRNKEADTRIVQSYTEEVALQQNPTSPIPHELVVRKGDTLSGIASQWYPDNSRLGMERILLSNPDITDRDLIFPGQVLSLPEP